MPSLDHNFSLDYSELSCSHQLSLMDFGSSFAQKRGFGKYASTVIRENGIYNLNKFL